MLEFASEQGEDALNDKLKEEYGVDLESSKRRKGSIGGFRKGSLKAPLPQLASRKQIFRVLSTDEERVSTLKKANGLVVVTNDTIDRTRLELEELMKQIQKLGLRKNNRNERSHRNSAPRTQEVALDRNLEEKIMKTGTTLLRIKNSGGLDKLEEILKGPEDSEEEKQTVHEEIKAVISATELLGNTMRPKEGAEEETEEETEEQGM